MQLFREVHPPGWIALIWNFLVRPVHLIIVHVQTVELVLVKCVDLVDQMLLQHCHAEHLPSFLRLADYKFAQMFFGTFVWMMIRFLHLAVRTYSAFRTEFVPEVPEVIMLARLQPSLMHAASG